MIRRYRRLPRLERGFYQGAAAVHWTACMENRARGLLTNSFHHHFREVLIHMAIRHHCVVPVYCLMPDHFHFLLLGTADDADLHLAMRFLRKHTAKALLPLKYQRQAYDHALTEKELERNAFEGICYYIVENPVRAGLCERADQYSYSGSVVPGFPDLRIHDAEFWDLFWRICQKLQGP
jgi:REP element-mobilizing transposase RayT